MCRSIRPLFNFEPPATEEEIRAAALQFVRKLSGFQSPSAANRVAFERAVDEVAAGARRLVGELVTASPPRTREQLAAQARARALKRFGPREGRGGGVAAARGATARPPAGTRAARSS